MLTEFLKIGLGFERLFFFILIDILVLHLVSCIWLIVGQMGAKQIGSDVVELQEEDPVFDGLYSYANTWFQPYKESNYTDGDMYVVSMYWAVTTITTVGYGDISGTNNFERVFCSVMMIIGVILFSFASGALASILQNYDNSNALFQEKLVVLNKIYKEFKLPLELFIKIKKTMGYESKKDMHDLHNFLNELPYKLKTELSLYVYEQRYMQIKFFKSKNNQFILWMCPQLKPQVYTREQYMYMETENVNEIFFLIHGLAAFVLPRYKNTGYIYIKTGSHFGVIDIVGSC